MTSWPSRRTGMASAWMGVGCRIPCASSMRCRVDCMGNWANDVARVLLDIDVALTPWTRHVAGQRNDTGRDGQRDRNGFKRPAVEARMTAADSYKCSQYTRA